MRQTAIERDRRKWAEKAMEGVVPDDIAREKQTDLATQLTAVRSEQSRYLESNGDQESLVLQILALLPDCGLIYRRAAERVRRMYNQAWFTGLYLSVKEGVATITSVERTGLLDALHSVEIYEEAKPLPAVTSGAPDDQGNPGEPLRALADALFSEREKPGSWRYRVFCRVSGSKVALLVGAEGLEPPTLSV